MVRPYRYGDKVSSICLDDDYWRALSTICNEQGKCIGRLIEEIAQGASNKTAAVRNFILNYYMREAA